MADLEHDKPGQAIRKQLVGKVDEFGEAVSDVLWQPAENVSELQILDDEELERNLVVLRSLRSVQAQIGTHSVNLDQRISVLTGGREVDFRDDAVSPARISEAVGRAAASLLQEETYCITFLGVIARHIADDLGSLYEELNQFLAENGILPNLGGVTAKREPAQSDEAGSEKKANPTKVEGMRLLHQIRSLLYARSNPHGGSREAPAPTDEIDQEIAPLQRADLSDPKSLHKSLKERLRELAPRMRAEQAAALELVDWLHETMVAEAEAEDSVRSLMHLLDAPMMRVALREADYLGDPDHPARKFTEAVGKAIQLVPSQNVKNLPARRLRETLENLTRELDGSTRSLQDAHDVLNRQTTRFELMAEQREKRVRAAEIGRERLDEARHKTRKILSRLIDRFQPQSEEVRNFLVTTWQDYMALIFMREGEATPAWDEASLAAKALAASHSTGRAETTVDSLLNWIPRLTKVLFRGLTQTGCMEETARDEAKRLALQTRTALEQAKSNTHSTIRPVRVVDVASIPELSDPFQEARDEYMQIDGAYRSNLERLKLMPFGTWITLKRDNGQVVHRRLSWLSPMSNRCLMVDLAGGSESVKLTELAQWMTSGTAEKAEGRPSLVERAMKSVMSRLSGLMHGQNAAATKTA